MKLTITNDQETISHIREKLKDFNVTQIGAYQKDDYCLAYYDNNIDELIAGLYAFQTMGRFYIDILWVSERYRNKGLGSKLLQAAAEEAKKNGNLYVRVNTGSFQAPEFYKKHGYEIIAKLPIKTEKSQDEYEYYFVKYL